MSSVSVKVVGGDAILAKFAGYRSRVQEELRKAVEKSAIQVQGVVKAKLSGEVLKAQTGTLRRSINYKMVEEGSNIAGSVGTNVAYAAVHEYGFNGTVSVRAHLRRTRGQVQAATTTRRNSRGELVSRTAKTGAKGRGTGTIQVGAFSRRMHVPERSFLRASLRDMSGTIRTNLTAAVMGALK